MHSFNSAVFKPELEELLLSTYPTKEDDDAEESPDQHNAPCCFPDKTNTSPERERSQSLYSFGSNLKQRQAFMSAAISEDPESIESCASDNRLSNVTLPKPNRSSKKFRTLNTLLLEALRFRKVEEIEKLIIAGANPNATCCIECISACHLAAVRTDGALALLLSHGADKNRSDKTGRTPLHIAAWAGNIKQIAMLLGFSKDLTNRISTASTSAAFEEVKNLSQFIKDVVNAKCSISRTKAKLPKEWMDNMIDHDCKEFEKSLPLFQPGWTPLHAASSRAKSNCVKLLLAAGADPSLRDLVGRSPLDIAGSTFYSDDYIDPDSFSETISVLAEGKSDFSIKNRKTLDTPLHTAVELNCIEAVKTLLRVNVPVGWLNRAGLSPVHICVKKRLNEIMQVLVNHIPLEEDEPYLKAVVDVRDRDGHTVLHAAILEGWEHGVSIAIDAGANVIAKDNNGETPLHIAASVGNLEVLKKVLNAAKEPCIINEVNSRSETPLIKAVLNRHTECVRKLLKEKASIEITLPHQINVFHIASERGYYDVLRILLDNDYNITRAMINYLADDKDGFGPIHYAVQNNFPKCVKLILSRNGYRCLKTSFAGNHIGSTPLHIAAITNNVVIAKILIKNNPETVHNRNNLDWTPLHTACSYGSRDMILLLLKEGADLSGIAIGSNGKTKLTAIELIMNSLSKPTEFMTHVFDTYISTNDSNIQDPNCEVSVDYQVLLPTAESQEQMKVIDALLKSGDRHEQRRLLVHPLLESFLHLKWKALLPFFYTMIIMYGIYVMVLTAYVITVFFYKDMNEQAGSNKTKRPDWIDPMFLGCCLYITSILVIALEALYININVKYFLQLETWIKFGAMLIALNLPNAVATLDSKFQEFARHMATLALLLSWLEMMFLLSRFPKWGYYVLMFGKVSSNVIKILLTFSFLVIGFSLSFMVEFHHAAPFEGPWSAFVKTLVMMASEYDYGDMMEAKIGMNNSTTDSFSIFEYLIPSMLMFRLVFVIFLILASIVLMNLMVGVAVNDLNDLQVLGNIRRLTKQVEFLVSLDTLLYNRHVRFILPKTLEGMLIKKKTISSVMTLSPNDPNSIFYKDLPSDIRDSIFEIAQLRNKQREEELGTQNYRKKIDKIYDAIVNKKSEDRANLEVAKKFYSYDAKGQLGLKNITQKIIDLDSGIVDSNKQNAATLNEMRCGIKELEIKMEMIFNILQTYSSNQNKSYMKMFRRDK